MEEQKNGHSIKAEDGDGVGDAGPAASPQTPRMLDGDVTPRPVAAASTKSALETAATPRPPSAKQLLEIAATPRPTGPPPKRQRHNHGGGEFLDDGGVTPRPGPSTSDLAGHINPETPTMMSTSDGDAYLHQRSQQRLTGGSSSWDESDLPKTPVASVMARRTSSTGSASPAPSDLSSSSRGGRGESPTFDIAHHHQLTHHHHEVPPAPPSTPASNVKQTMSSSALDGLSTPLPYAAVQNADELLEQQLLSDGAVTPAPPKKEPPTNEQPTEATTGGAHSKSNLLGTDNDFSEWAVGERYKLLRMLGRGSYGEVAQAVDLYQGKADSYVAIKRIQSPFDQEVDAVRLYREIHILRRLRGHNCIIQLVDVVQPPSDDLDDFHDLYLVFEYVDTDLYKLIMSPQYLTTEHIQTFLYQMLIGVKYLHSADVIHRDLKPANILLNEDCSLKICDFGLARIVDSPDAKEEDTGSDKAGKDVRPDRPDLSSIKRAPLTRQLTKHVVTRWYRAPELILIQPYTSAVDIWSLGCILAELLSMQEGSVPGYQDRTPLFPGGTCYPLSGAEGGSNERRDQLSVIFGVIGTPSPEDIAAIGKANEYIKTLGSIKSKKLEDLYPAADPVALDLLKQMLRFNPDRRCTAEQALEHDFLKSVRKKEMERTADKPLEAPEFLSSVNIDLKLLKRETYEEVVWFRDHQDREKPQAQSAPAS